MSWIFLQFVYLAHTSTAGGTFPSLKYKPTVLRNSQCSSGFFFPRFLHKDTTANPSENFSCFICSHLQRLSFLHALLHFFPRSFSMASAWDRGFYYMENFTPFPFPIHYIPGPLDLRALWLSLAPWFSLSITGTYGELLQQHSTYSSSPAMWHSCGTFISKGFQTLSSLCFHVHARPSSFSEMQKLFLPALGYSWIIDTRSLARYGGACCS